jgi:hypothetical protein
MAAMGYSGVRRKNTSIPDKKSEDENLMTDFLSFTVSISVNYKNICFIDNEPAAPPLYPLGD